MGMFDSVYVNCPECNTQNEIQSKAGDCDLKRYHFTSVPAVIAEDISGEVVKCYACNTRFSIEHPNPNCRVNMIVKTVKTNEDHWD